MHRIFIDLLLWLPAVWGIGLLIPGGPKRLWGDSGLLGILAIVLAATLINFAAPLGAWFSPLCLVIGYGGLVLGWKGQAASRTLTRAVFALVLLCLLSFTTFYQTPVFDAGLYHFPMTVWSQQAALPLGLANLNPFLGYNSLWPLLGSALPLLLTETALLFFFFLGLLEKAFERDSGRYPSASLLAFLLLTACMLAGLDSGAGTNSTDVPMAVYLLSSALNLLAGNLMLSAVFALFGLSVKLSALPFCAGIFFFVFLHEKSARFRLRLIAFSVAILIPWGIRGVMTTGCLAFPQKHSCVFSLPWATSVESALERERDIKETAGNCLIQPASEQPKCFRAWVQASVADRSIQVCLLVSLLGAAALLRRRQNDFLPEERIRLRMLVGLFALCLVFWFASAPKARFGFPYLVGFGAVLAVAGFSGLRFFATSRRGQIGWVLLLVLISGRRIYNWNQASLYEWSDWPRIAVYTTELETLSTGQTIRVPISDPRCGLTQQPCRDPGSIGVKMGQLGGRTYFGR